MLSFRKRILIGMLAFVALLSGCAAKPARDGSSGAAGEEAFAFMDSTEVEITAPRNPQKVAVLFSSLADIWVVSGGTVSVTVGEAVERGFALEEAVLVDQGSGHTDIDLETLAAEKPDFVICTADYEGQTQAAAFCNGAGIPAACFHVESFSDYLWVLNIFCTLTGNPDRYETYGTETEKEVNACLAEAAQAEIAYKRILFIRSGSSASSAKAKTSDQHFACAMLKELGTVNIAESNGVLLDGLSLEVILKENPDYIFISTMGSEDAAREYVLSLFESAGWRELSAVKEGRYVFLPKELFQFKPNARWAEAYRYLFDILCPEQEHGR